VSGIREGISIRGLAVEPGNSDVVYAAGEINSWQWAGRDMWGVGFDRTKGSVYKSTDAGLHWKEIWFGDDLARYVLIDPTDVDTLYLSTGIFDREAANSDPATRTPGGVGVLKSSDGGETWLEANDGIENLYVGSLAIHPEDPQILLAAAGNVTYNQGSGVYLTRDGAEHWEKVIEGSGFFMAVDFVPGDPVTAYAAAGHSPFYRSLDDGQTWEAMTPGDHGWGPPGFRVALPIDMQVDPRDPDRVFVNNYGGGNYLSADGGRSWTSASNGYSGAEIWDVAVDPSNPAAVYANGRSGLFASLDGGVSWDGINPVNPTIQDGPQIVIDPDNPAHLLASEGQFGWTFESRNAGRTWTNVVNLHELEPGGQVPTHLQSGVHAIAFAPSDPARVYAGLNTWGCATDPRRERCVDPTVYSLMASQNGGRTWSPILSEAIEHLPVFDVLVHPAEPEAVWLATGSAGVLYTGDGGVTWEPRSSGLASSAITSLAMHADNPDILYAGTADRGVYKSEDGGSSWRRSGAGMDANEPVRALLLDPIRPNVLYAGSSFSGVYLSEDAGATWRQLNDGLRTRAIRSLAISSDGETLYAATIGEGVFRLSTHAQDYFDSLAPAPTPTSPPTALPTQDANAAPIVIDGMAGDWADVQVSGTDPAGDQSPGSPDLGEIRAVNDSRFFYLHVHLHETGDTNHYDVLLDVNGGDYDYQLSFWPEENQGRFATFPVTAGMQPLDGVEAAQAEVIEVKMPLSAVGDRPVRRFFVQTFLGASAGDQAPDLAAATLSQAPAPTNTPTDAPRAAPTSAQSTEQTAEPASTSGGLPCLGGALPLAPLGLIWHRRRQRRGR
jgi:photosystem II stability/assembly factor-like uncharacterized protein